MFNQDDLKLFAEKGITADQVEQQLEQIKSGFPYIDIVSPAMPRDGIIKLTEEAVVQYGHFAEEKLADVKVAKFVPASGAASRMFKMLFTTLEKCKDPAVDPDSLTENEDDFYSFGYFMKNLSKFGFFNDLEIACVENGLALRELVNAKDYKTILELLLTEKGLNYGNLPKGLLRFHRYFNYNRTATEEHLVEGAEYAKNSDNSVKIHFTVSENHQKLFEDHIAEVLPKYEKQFKVKYDISFSIQKPHTDTVAADENFGPFRDQNGKIVFRPAGHGALLENLSDIIADIIFIKNIDNVVPDSNRGATVTYKKVLASVLIELQSKIKLYLDFLNSDAEFTEQRAIEIFRFAEKNLGYKFDSSLLKASEQMQKETFIKILDRPVRVCGMVKNNGEPGGGPFWVRNADGSQSLQIIEKAQINTKDPDQVKVLARSTHFNPVDIVVCRCKINQKLCDFSQFVDPNAGIVTKKSQNGKDLYALELPGLWNGAMANWNTVFVEVPLETFNPVKEVNDLLRNEHIQLSE